MTQMVPNWRNYSYTRKWGDKAGVIMLHGWRVLLFSSLIHSLLFTFFLTLYKNYAAEWAALSRFSRQRAEALSNWIWKKQLSSQSADELGEREYIYFCVCIIKEHSANSFEREINTPRRSGKNKPESNWANYEQQQLVAARSMSRKRFHFIFNHSRTAWRFASIELKFIIKFEAARALQSHYYSFSTTIIKLKRFNWHNGCRGINLA